MRSVFVASAWRRGLSILVSTLSVAGSAGAGPTYDDVGIEYDHYVHLTPENSAIGNFPAEKRPILTIASGETVRIDTGGGAGWRRSGLSPDEWLADNHVPITSADPALAETIAVLEKTPRYGGIENGHLLVGPIAIEDAMPGDSIEVRVLSVEPRIPYGTTGRTPGRGLKQFEGERPPAKVTTFDLERRVALFGPGVEVPLAPFMGVMALLPPDSDGPNRRSGPPGLFAGNLDLKELVAGSTLYIPVFHPGGLFYTGDAHAVQGDGEISGTAIETANTAILQFILHKGKTLSAPRAETPTHYIAIGIDPDLDAAMQMAADQTVEWLHELKGYDAFTAIPLASMGIDYRITQIVDGTKGVHAMIPKKYFVDARDDYWYQPPEQPAERTGFHLEEATIDDIQRALLAKRITTVGLVEQYLARIEAYNGTCVKQPNGILGAGVETIPHAGQINALSTLNLRPAARKHWGFDARKARSMTDAADDDPGMPDALETAALQDAELARTGKLVGPLHGVVLALKDQYDTFDMRSTSGADAFYADDRPPDDATFVARLRAAGAIILAKANLAEYANGGARSSFGGTFCNPYDTERTPSSSSSGSGSSVAANLVTCAIAEETGSSIRGPARANNAVGIAPTQELISRDGMIQPGINTRVGPICRTVKDAAKILGAYAGYDPKDELTVYSVGRLPPRPYEDYASATRLDGVRVGVVRELFDKAALTPASDQTVDLINAALADLKSLGAEIIDPGPGGALLGACVRKYAPRLGNKLFTDQYPQLFPVDEHGEPVGDHIATLVEMAMDPSKVPADFSFMTLPRGDAEGESRFSMNLYLAERGDISIRTNTDLVRKANWLDDPNYPDFKGRRIEQDKEMRLDMSERMLDRFQVQTTVLECMQELDLDAMTYPTSNLPPEKLGSPSEPRERSRASSSSLGRQGFPAITVPAGFTTGVYDRVVDPAAPLQSDGKPGTKLVGPVPAKVPVGIDFVGRPFDEPTLLEIASAYETATHHRTAPPEFGPVPATR